MIVSFVCISTRDLFSGTQLIISLKLNDNIAAIKHVVLIMTMLVQLYLYCYAGDQLESVTAKLSYNVYTTTWYEFDVKLMRNLPMVMMRGKMPHQITAGKFLPMNIYSFKEVLKATCSYISVLRVMIDV